MPALAVGALLHERADGEREVAHARRRGRQPNRLRVEPGDSQNGQARCRIPPDELGFERVAVVTPDVQAVLAAERTNHRQHDIGGVHKSAGGTPAALHLYDRGRGEGDGVGE